MRGYGCVRTHEHGLEYMKTYRGKIHFKLRVFNKGKERQLAKTQCKLIEY